MSRAIGAFLRASRRCEFGNLREGRNFNKEAGQDFEFIGGTHYDEELFGVGTGIALRQGDPALWASADGRPSGSSCGASS